MSNEAEKIDHRKLPRRKRPLSIRDQAILLAYRSQARTQEQLAKDYHLSQSRICQILRRAAQLEAEPAAAGPPSISSPIRNPKSEIPNETALNPTVAAQARAQDIFIRALRAFDRWPAELKTIRHADRDGKTLDEETIRQQAPSSPMLRVALNSHRELCRLEDQAKQQQAAAELSPEERRQQIEAALVELYDAACRAGKVEYHIEPDCWMRDLVKILLGEPHRHWLPVYILAKNIGKDLVDLPKPATRDDDDDPSSFPGSGLETHSPEAPASSCGDDNPNTVPPLAEDGPCDHSERRVELGTRNSSNCSNPASTESAEVESAPSVAMKRPKSKTESEPIKPYNSPPPKPTSPQVRAYLDEVNRFNEENTRRLQPAIAETMRPMREAAMREKHSADAKRAASEASTS